MEFVYTSCSGFNCWVEPRCTVESVTQTTVTLKQSTGNSSCWHRMYYFGVGWGGKDTPDSKPPLPPTSIENLFDPDDFTVEGTWYYDRAAATITYLPRAGETAQTLEATAVLLTYSGDDDYMNFKVSENEILTQGLSHFSSLAGSLLGTAAISNPYEHMCKSPTKHRVLESA